MRRTRQLDGTATGRARNRQPPDRFVATILFTDIVGSTERAVQLGDAEWRRLLSAHHTAVRRELRRFGGREIDTAGDGFFAVFDQPTKAVRAADAIVAAVAKLGIAIRAGIHTGEAESVGEKVGGIAVHIASRVMAAAAPGQVLLSGTVRDLVAGSGLEFSDAGERQLKGIPGDWRLWELVRDGGVSSEVARPRLPLPDKPSIAVLPFTNLGGDHEQDYFADGMVQDIITSLSRIKWIFVIARNSSFAYRGRSMDVKQIGAELGVRYVLEGSLRKAADRVRVTAQLVDAASGAHIWAERYDRALDDVFALQDELTMSVVGVIEPTLRGAEIERARRKRPENLDAYDLYLRALPFTFTAMPRDADQALELLERAIELEPGYAAVHALMAWCHEQRYLRGGLQEEARSAALEHARAAIASGGDDATALATAAFVVAVVDNDFKTATAAFERSFSLSTSSALALGFSSIVRAWIEDCETATDQAKRAIRLSPYDPLLYLPYIGLAYAGFLSGRFDESADAAARAAESNPRFTVPYILGAAALANVGDQTAARDMVGRLRALEPAITASTAVQSARFANPERRTELRDALVRAGLPS